MQTIFNVLDTRVAQNAERSMVPRLYDVEGHDCVSARVTVARRVR